MSPQPTPRQSELLEKLHQFIRKTGRLPSQGDMAKAMKCSKHTIRELIAPLERKGLVTRTPGVANSLKPANLRLIAS